MVRVDALAKVCGRATFTADLQLVGMAEAVLVTSSITRGSIRSIDASPALAVPGSLAVLTHHDAAVAALRGEFAHAGGRFHSSLNPLSSPDIHHAGQIVAVVCAETREAAEQAAALVEVDYDERPSCARLGSGPLDDDDVVHLAGNPVIVGDPPTTPPHREITATYATPAMHHHPIEPFITSATWVDDKLQVFVPSQWVLGQRAGLAETLGLPDEDVEVVSTFVGGAFGSKAYLLWHTVFCAVMSRSIHRPVRLAVSRPQMSTVGPFRPETRHDVTLGADAEGRIDRYRHLETVQTSRHDDNDVGGSSVVAALYGGAYMHLETRLARRDVPTPGSMRGPVEFPAAFALESAVDELAEAAGIDPLRMRLDNDTDVYPITGQPFSSRSLTACLTRGARLFGWGERRPPARSMRDSDGRWLGWGCASAVYPVLHTPVRATVTADASGAVIVRTAAHDLGTGAFTVLAQIAAEELAIPVHQVRVELGSSDFPAGPMTAGSTGTASVGSAVAAAARSLRADLVARASSQGEDVRLPELVAATGEQQIEAKGGWAPPGLPSEKARQSYAGRMIFHGPSVGTHAAFAFGAHFVEVAVDPVSRAISLERMVGVFGCGRIINPRTTRAQLIGGMVWGASHALLEHTDHDRAGRIPGSDLASYHFAVNADFPHVQVETVDEVDEFVNPLGVKGVGEIGVVGTAAAVANAVRHATGVRVRHTPILSADLLAAEMA